MPFGQPQSPSQHETDHLLVERLELYADQQARQGDVFVTSFKAALRKQPDPLSEESLSALAQHAETAAPTTTAAHESVRAVHALARQQAGKSFSTSAL